MFESRNALVEIHPVALHLHPRSAIATLPVPLHPGATAYYRSVKYAHDERPSVP
ncbi:TAXI family TRAP transporter solute-binding subunit [Nocardiopsis sp. NPDC006832]|uniref:TAXI family TRAP transporter solute-binding subunit n=1 Tax=Nocardiopsis sp. NPDC006832 TaxID=3157188 RepID=UPI00340F98BE